MSASVPAHVLPFRMGSAQRWGWLVLAMIFVWAASHIDITWLRFVSGLDGAAKFVHRMLPPIFNPRDELVKGMLESVQIVVLASAAGVLLSLPIGLLVARNMMPVWVTWSARLLITLCRTFDGRRGGGNAVAQTADLMRCGWGRLNARCR